MVDYMVRQAREHGTPWSAIARHMLGLRNGLPGARRWRQVWSDHRLKELDPREVMDLAHRPAALADWLSASRRRGPAQRACGAAALALRDSASAGMTRRGTCRHAQML